MSVKRKRLVIIAAVVFVAAVFVVVLWPGEREPEYQGRKLSEWLEYAPGIPTRILRASDGRVLFDAQIDAIQHMGTNGTRLLVHWLQYEPAKWRLKLRGSMGNAAKPWRLRLYSWLTPAAERRAGRAAAVLRGLKWEELPLEALERIAADPKRPYAARRVKSLLIEIRLRQSLQRNLIA